MIEVMESNRPQNHGLGKATLLSKIAVFFGIYGKISRLYIYIWYVYQVYIETLSIQKCKRFGPYQTVTVWISENHSTALVITKTLPAPNHKVRKKFRGYFRGTCSDLSNATMEVGRSFEEVWGRSFAGLVGSGFPETCDKRFVLFFLFGKGRKSGRHFIFIFVWKRKR